MHFTSLGHEAPYEQSLSNPAVRQALLIQQLHAHVGKRFIVMHLTSERGRELNGRSCVVTGHDGARLVARLDDNGTSVKWV